MDVMTAAVTEVLDNAVSAFLDRDHEKLLCVQPLEEVVDDLKEALRSSHIRRLQQGICSIEVGFVWADLLTNLERVADHCANISGCLMDLERQDMNFHQTKRLCRPGNPEFDTRYSMYAQKYSLENLE